MPPWYTSMDYSERERARGSTLSHGHRALGPRDPDAKLFRTTRKAALRTIARANASPRLDPATVLKEEADRNLPARLPGGANRVRFLEEHLKTLLMPILFG